MERAFCVHVEAESQRVHNPAHESLGGEYEHFVLQVVADAYAVQLEKLVHVVASAARCWDCSATLSFCILDEHDGLALIDTYFALLIKEAH